MANQPCSGAPDWTLNPMLFQSSVDLAMFVVSRLSPANFPGMPNELSSTLTPTGAAPSRLRYDQDRPPGDAANQSNYSRKGLEMT